MIVHIITCTWRDENGCGTSVAGVYKNKKIAESVLGSLKVIAERRNLIAKNAHEDYELSSVEVADM